MSRLPGPVGTTVQQLVDERVVPADERAFFVWRSDAVAGMLTVGDLVRVPRSKWPTTTVGEAMQPAARLATIEPGASAMQAVRLMQDRNVQYVPVLDDGRLVGILAMEDIERFVESRTREV